VQRTEGGIHQGRGKLRRDALTFASALEDQKQNVDLAHERPQRRKTYRDGRRSQKGGNDELGTSLSSPSDGDDLPVR